MSDTTWMEQAVCAQPDADDDWVDPLQREEEEEREARITRAKAGCNVCPVREECLEYALTIISGITIGLPGVWAGYTEDEIRTIRRKRRRHAAREVVQSRATPQEGGS